MDATIKMVWCDGSPACECSDCYAATKPASPAPCAPTFQDAYHYALAAAGCEDSTFFFEGPRDRAHGWTRKDFLEQAAERLRSMGFASKAPRTLREARAFASNIEGLARVYGISAYRGESLCKVCGGDTHPTSDHDHFARLAAKAVAR